MAIKAVLYEISLTPKPGLVDKFGNGTHTDMNYQTFLNSSAAISAWFADLAHEGYKYQGKDLTKALPVIRNLGLRMETAMFSATQNVNTQKGLIFLMGISLFACGYLFARQNAFEIEVFRGIVKQICKDLTGKELERHNLTEKTHGEEIYDRYHVSGARGEVESGFSTVFEVGLPILLNYQELNNEALLKLFFQLRHTITIQIFYTEETFMY